ncbi:hypothetical protein HAX54_011604, partial [Datura stramonium]|nr:hypothetical protein [Datura stramonium]
MVLVFGHLQGSSNGSIASFDGGTRCSYIDDTFNNAMEIMNLDAYAGWCTSPD